MGSRCTGPDSGWFSLSYWQGPLRKGRVLEGDQGWVEDSMRTLVVRDFGFISQQEGAMQERCMTGSLYQSIP